MKARRGTAADRATAEANETGPPRLQLLSNGRYHVMVTEAGGGYSRWKGLALTRWREDITCDNRGSFCFVRDRDSGEVWSTATQPMLQRTGSFSTAFSPGLATFRVVVHDVEVQTDVTVSAVDDVELRRVRITNHAAVRRALDLTSYAEIVLAPGDADAAHPAFEKLFVETEVLTESQAIVCTRRARTPKEATPSWFHLVGTVQPPPEPMSYETDRARFVGRGRTPADPQALDDGACLSGSAGAVLDPVAAIRCGVSLGPGETVTVDLINGVSDTHDGCLELIRKYRDCRMADLVTGSATTHALALLDRLQSSADDARTYAHLASSILHPDAALRADAGVLAANEQGQPGLWRYGISGDLPIVLLRADDLESLGLARRLIKAHTYWRLCGLAVDLVILAGGQASDATELLQRLVALADPDHVDKPGGVFVRPIGKVPDADRVLLQAVACVVIDDEGPLLPQRERRPTSRPNGSAREARVDAGKNGTQSGPAAGSPETELLFRNGLGGFTPDGREYVITITPARMTPAPWVNVLANPGFGTMVSESGSAATWSENAQTFRLTPWSNDPVADANTEAFYLRDEDSGHCWSPTLLPRAGATPYVTRHGFGYSAFEHREHEIDSELTVFVAIDAPIKFALLKLGNRSDHDRHLSVTGYVEWVLGDERAKTAMHVSTSVEAGAGCVYARNPYTIDFPGRTAFFDVDRGAAADSSVCGDRREFIGRQGSLRDPAAMSTPHLSGTVGFALDPCAAIRACLTLTAGQTTEIVFRLGAGATQKEAAGLAARGRGPDAAHEALVAVKRHWSHTLGAVQVETPDRSLDLLVNGWLPYQTLACRLWARNAFYQSSGAFGFRDQLQDVMALVHVAPALVREHLLRSAARQFPEGDAQHWWHPPAGRGVRTRCSDDFLWLPFAACRYVVVTGDGAVLDEPVPFLKGTALEDGEASNYELPTVASESATLYEHCVRAVKHGLLRFGEHGLPLMGAGDWNDGMNLVGAEGRGESVWLGFFLYAVLVQFGRLAKRRGDATFALTCEAGSVRLRAAIERSAWDGDWYRRGWFDDGSPLGSAANTECRIASIAQSWAVLSGAGDASRARAAMEALDAHLLDRDAAVIRLLAPPFDHSRPSPGYIQGYLPGVRENGGQYTHAAVWAAMAFASLGDAKRAWELFEMIDPIRHADSPQAIAIYKTEPYVIASDVYALPPHVGRGGWTWYTGSAGWMLRFALESLLGLHVEADQLQITPCLPSHWRSYRIGYRYRETLYRITVSQILAADDGVVVTVDGIELAGSVVALADDRREHAVEVRLRRQVAQFDAHAGSALRADAPTTP